MPAERGGAPLLPDLLSGGLRDLSHPIEDGMPVYPGDPTVSVRAALTVSRDGVDVASIHMGSHTGTHVDAPSHTVPGGRTMRHVSLDEMVGEALVLHIPGLADGEVYDWKRLEEARPLPPSLPPIVIIDTGWARWFDQERRLRHPALDPSAARELVGRGMRVLAVDSLSPDPTGGDAFPVHDEVLGADRLIVENLRGLEGLPTSVVVGFFPLALGGDGAPVRAVAFLPATR